MNVLRAQVTQLKQKLAVRFVVVGVVNTLFAYLVYASFIFLGFRYEVANLISLVAGILFSFKTQGRFVFRNTSHRLIGRFVLSWVVIYFWTIFVIGQFVRLGIDAYTAGLLALPFSVGFSFFIQKFLVFSSPRRS